MTTNPICSAMGWQPPGQNEHLIISLNGKDVAQLTAQRGRYLEGLYLINPAGHQYGPCLSIIGKRSAAEVRSQLAQKLRVEVAKLNLLTAEIYSASKLRG